MAKHLELGGTVDGMSFTYADGVLRVTCTPTEALRLLLGFDPTAAAGQGQYKVPGAAPAEHLALGAQVLPFPSKTPAIAAADLQASDVASRVAPSGGDSGQPSDGAGEGRVPEELRGSATLRPIIEWYCGQGEAWTAERIAEALEQQRGELRCLRQVKELKPRVESILDMVKNPGPLKA